MKRATFAITGELARAMPRFEFIAFWLATVTRKKSNRGPLGLYVRKIGKQWRVISPIAGGTVIYTTPSPDLLYDFVRRTQLGPEVQKAEHFRVEAFTEHGKPRWHH